MAKTKRRGKGEGSIYQRADGRWVGQVQNGRCPGGHQRRDGTKCLGGERRTVRVVRTKHDDVVDEMNKLRSPGHSKRLDGSMSVSDFLDLWIEHVQTHPTRPAAPGTVKTYRSMVRTWLKPHLGTIKLRALEADDVEAMLRAMRAQGLRPASITQARAITVRSLKWAVQKRKIAANVAREVDGPRGGKAAKLDDMPTPEETERLLAAAAGDRFEAAAVLNLRVGMRIGEVINLRWDDVDLDAGLLSVRRSKTAAGVREVPILDDEVRALRARRATQAADQLKAGPLWRDTGFVFTGDRGACISDSAMRQWWHKLGEKAGTGHRRFHSGRHAAATEMFNDGHDRDVVSKTLGHRRSSTTSDIYIHVEANVVRKARAKTMTKVVTETDAARVLREAGVSEDVIAQAFGLPKASGDA